MNKPGQYISNTYTFQTKKAMIDYLYENKFVAYKNHTVQTVEGRGCGLWHKVASTYYFVQFTSGNLNRVSVS